MQQRQTARTALAAPDAKRAARPTPRVVAQLRLSDTINAGAPSARLATMGALANGVVQRQGDDDEDSARSGDAVSGAVTSAQDATVSIGSLMSAGHAPVPHRPQPSAAAAAASVAGPAAAHRSKPLPATIAAMPPIPSNKSLGADSGGSASGSALASGSAGATVSAAAAAGGAGDIAPPPAGQMHAPIPIPAGIGGSARHALPNLLYASHAAGAPPEEGSLYFADGTRTRMVHRDGPYVSTQARDRHVLGVGGQLQPAAAGQGGKLVEFAHGMLGAAPDHVSHVSRGSPAAAPIRNSQQLAQIAAVASAATPAIAAARAGRDAAARGTSAHARAEGDYIGALNHYNALMRDAVGNPPPGLAVPAAIVAPAAGAAGEHAPHPGGSAAGASGAGSSTPAHPQPQPAPANAAAAAAAAAPAAGIDLATATARDALVLIARAHLATIDARSRTGPPGEGSAAGGRVPPNSRSTP